MGPNGIVVPAAGTEVSATSIEVLDMVTDVKGVVSSKVVPMAYRGNFDLDICKSAEEKSHKGVEKLKNYQFKRIEESNAAKDKPNTIKHDPMSNDELKVLNCDKCQMIFHSSIHLRAHQMYNHGQLHIGGYSAEASYSKPNHLLQNCTATSVSPCMYHPR